MFGYKKVLAILKDRYDEYLKEYDECETKLDPYRFEKIISNYDVISVVLKLEIPDDAVVVMPDDAYFFPREPIKHRCSKAMPVSAAVVHSDIHGSLLLDNYVLFSRYDPHFTYEIGKMAIPDDFDTNHRHVCSHGIHFFETADDAINY